MTFTSYAQNFEDVMLLRALGDVDRGFFIDVGACDPTIDNVARLFYDRGWRGLNVEPTPDHVARLERERPGDRTRAIALSDTEGTATFHVFAETGLSTLAAGVADGHVSAGREARALSVPVTTLRRLWDEDVPPGQDVHFLKIDVEGEEAAVIRGADWARHRPWIVVVEATAPNSQLPSHADWEPVLLGQGYRFVYFDGLNRFYLAEEHADLAPAFAVPPNVFDDFVHYRQVLVERHAERLADRANSLDADLAATRRALADRETALAAALRDASEFRARLNWFDRPLWQRLLFRRRDGRPTRPLRRLLFHANGKPRGIFRDWVLQGDGRPRPAFRDWMASPAYQALPRAVRVAACTEAQGDPEGVSPRTRYFLERLQRRPSRDAG